MLLPGTRCFSASVIGDQAHLVSAETALVVGLARPAGNRTRAFIIARLFLLPRLRRLVVPRIRGVAVARVFPFIEITFFGAEQHVALFFRQHDV